MEKNPEIQKLLQNDALSSICESMVKIDTKLFYEILKKNYKINIFSHHLLKDAGFQYECMAQMSGH